MTAPSPIDAVRKVDALRTGDAAFANLPGYAFEPHYLDDLRGYEGLRLHFVDEGPRDAAVTFLCLHRQPTWSYLYRHMISVFAAAGHRVVAPDWFGFGRSDKPVADGVYSFAFHRDAMLEVVTRLDLHNVVLVCQDWGGLLGLTLPMAAPERYTRLLVMNTALATGHAKPSLAFFLWRTYSNLNPNMNVAALMRFSCKGITREESEAYNAPFPNVRFKAGVRRFPRLVPTTPSAGAARIAQDAERWWQQDWTGESFMAVGKGDPILGGAAMQALRATVRNCPPPLELDAGHFVQEDAGAKVARAALTAFKLEGSAS
jgi:pimeloyl-ACP methyl ester carboxylesterase